MSVKDLSRGNTIRMHGLNGVEVTAKVKNVYRLVHSRRGAAKWVADVKAIDGKTWTIDDNYDFYSLPDENEENKKTLYDKINHPSHYTYGEIEIMDFIEQVTKDYKPQLESLSDEDLKGEELKEELQRSSAVSKVAQNIINNGSLVLQAQKFKDEKLDAESEIPKLLGE